MPGNRRWYRRATEGLAQLQDSPLTDQQHDLLLQGLLAQRRPASAVETGTLFPQPLQPDLQAPPAIAKMGAVINNIARGNTMKRLLMLLLLIGIAGCGPDAETENTPAALLKKIYALAQEEDYDNLQDCIFPHSEQDLPNMMLEGIKAKKERGDAAYSHKALKFLIDNHLDKLKPAAGAFLDSCMPDGDFGEDPRIAKIAETRPQDITMFDFQEVHILLIKFEGEHKLIFWERLPVLSGEYSLENQSKSSTGTQQAPNQSSH